MSYSYYLIHGLTLNLAFAVLPVAVATGGSAAQAGRRERGRLNWR